MPFRQIGALWSSVQLALASWARVSEILEEPIPTERASSTIAPITQGPLLEFEAIQFQYASNKRVIRDANFVLQPGKTYALVGPTGGGKTTTASLMARLHRPTSGHIRLHGVDLADYSPAERAQRIGFILQDPFLFSGTLLENIFFGHPTLAIADIQTQIETLQSEGFTPILARFGSDPLTLSTQKTDTLSLGQKQLVAFLRAVLRKPELLILDEATANIDTVTEQLLEEILNKLPSTTTKVIIAHRLNTIANADEIFFVSNGEIKTAGSLDQAIELLIHHKQQS